MNTINKEFVLSLGFKLNRAYAHDQFFTEEYRKGYICVEITYEKDRQINYCLVIEEVFFEPFTAEDLRLLTPILGKS